MKKIFGVTLLAILFIGICLRAADWQYDRHQARSSFNSLIEANLDRSTLNESEIPELGKDAIAWRLIELKGIFDQQREILIRNRYNNGQYGFGVVTLFISDAGRKYWIDRGWVEPGPDAKTPPKVSKIGTEEVTILGRARYGEIEKGVSGTVFALPNADGTFTLQKWNNSEGIETESFYIDLISTSNKDFDPEFPAPLPELSDGPHLAYTVQWLLFALFVIFGWFLILREEFRSKS